MCNEVPKTEEKVIDFTSLGIEEKIVEKLKENGIIKPTAVQQKIIPELNEGKSLLFQSETGTGKTLAFLLPSFKKIDPTVKAPQILIISPTHELSSQIKSEIAKISDFKSTLCFGGSPIKRQIDSLKEKPQFIIGSCVRIKELIFLKKIKTSDIKMVIYDEIDRLSQTEIRDDATELLSLLPKDIQFVGCSATVSSNVQKIFSKAISEDKMLDFIELPKEDILKNRITHIAIFSPAREKIDTLRSYINAEKFEKMLIFTSKLDQVENISQKLKYKKINCEALHAKTDKVQRKSIIDRFKSGKVPILITSDLTSRGLDIQNITHVVQMDLPNDIDFFIHRAGRTGRAQKNGFNVVIGDEYEMRQLSRIEKKLNLIVYPKMIRYGKIVSPEAK